MYAVDVGHGQLAPRLASDPRVVNMERTNISDPSLRNLCPRPRVATVDLSYLSLRKAIPVIAPLIEDDGTLVCLVKPLFEVDDPTTRRTGLITTDDTYIDVLRGLVAFVNDSEMMVKGISRSHIDGGKGTREFFLWIAKEGPSDQFSSFSTEGAILGAVHCQTTDR